ncbi:GtrA family protein [Comamonas aquatica]|uniref:GtrA family protein n=1 Tax=Comamonas aquatica TaxID=225991 RepID=UPI00244978A0|nr:GtrA family protein [Comamonas aquatica]MDH1380710.1 GtrA family protein [Comamonas aquatica]MDH1640630.1 GtrA family protein [Comamonas aquatica]
MITPQFIRFLVAGGIAAGANFGSRFVFSIFFAYGIAVFFAYLVGMLVAFLLMRGHVFNANQGPLTPQVIKFVGVNLVAVLQTLAISLLLARWVLPSVGIEDQAEALGHLVGVLVPVVTSYFGHKFLTFR